MTRVLTFACALLALGLAAWALYAGTSARGRLEETAQALSGFTRYSREDAAERLAAQAQADVQARATKGGGETTAPLLSPALPAMRNDGAGGAQARSGEEVAAETSPSGVGLERPAPIVTPRVERSSPATLGYTLPASAPPPASETPGGAEPAPGQPPMFAPRPGSSRPPA